MTGTPDSGLPNSGVDEPASGKVLTQDPPSGSRPGSKDTVALPCTPNIMWERKKVTTAEPSAQRGDTSQQGAVKPPTPVLGCRWANAGGSLSMSHMM